MPRKRTGSVFWHVDHWDVRVTMPDGTRSPIYHLKVGTTEARAKEIAAAWTEQAARGELLVIRRGGAGETVEEWFERWYADRRARSVGSKKDEGRLKKWMVPALGPLAMADLTPADLERLVEKLDHAIARHRAFEKSGQRPDLSVALSWKSASNVWALVTKACADAHMSKTKTLRVLKANPSADVPGPDVGTKKLRSFITPARFVAFVSDERVPLEWRRVVAIGIYLYERAAETRGVRWRDIDLEHGYMRVHRTVDAEGGEGSTKIDEGRRVPIERELVPLLRVMQGEPNEEAFRFPDEKHMARGLRRWLTRAGLDEGDLQRTATQAALTWHDVRATGITWRAIRGDDPLRIMRAAGHKDFKTTQRYIREAESLNIPAAAVFPPLPACLLESSGESSSAPSVGIEISSKQAANDGSGRWDLNPPHMVSWARSDRESGPSGALLGEAKSPKRGRADDSLTFRPLAKGSVLLGVFDAYEAYVLRLAEPTARGRSSS